MRLRVRVERVVVDGLDFATTDATALRDALATGLERRLAEQLAAGAVGGPVVSGEPRIRVRAAGIAASRDPRRLGANAAVSLAGSIAPLVAERRIGADGRGRHG